MLGVLPTGTPPQEEPLERRKECLSNGD